MVLARPFSGVAGVDYDSPLDTALSVGLAPVRALAVPGQRDISGLERIRERQSDDEESQVIYSRRQSSAGALAPQRNALDGPRAVRRKARKHTHHSRHGDSIQTGTYGASQQQCAAPIGDGGTPREFDRNPPSSPIRYQETKPCTQPTSDHDDKAGHERPPSHRPTPATIGPDTTDAAE